MNLVWFRNDLRVSDNTALWQACQEGGPVAGLFIMTPRQWQQHNQSALQVNFRLQCLDLLQQDLAALGIPLLVERVPLFGDIPQRLLALARQHRARAVYFNNEYPLDERQRDRVVESVLTGDAIACRRYHDRTLLPPGSVRNNSDRPYRVFTPFKQRYLSIIEEAGGVDILPAPAAMSNHSASLAGGSIPAELEAFPATATDAWPAGETAADRALQDFITEAVAGYESQRDFPAVEGTSRLSHHLAVGTLSPRQCLQAALTVKATQPGASAGASCWINELVWRDFYQHLVFDFPDVCKYQPFKPETDRIPWRDDAEDFQAWCDGKTGVPLVDAGMRQLQQTGWMHNRVRMVTAMYLSKNLLIDWRKGEAFFMAQLIDGDFASNNGGWQWSASTGTDAAPYFRVFNPFSQAAKYDPDATYIKRYVPELRELTAVVINHPGRLAKARPVHYPEQRVDLAESRQRVLRVFKAL